MREVELPQTDWVVFKNLGLFRTQTWERAVNATLVVSLTRWSPDGIMSSGLLTTDDVLTSKSTAKQIRAIQINGEIGERRGPSSNGSCDITDGNFNHRINGRFRLIQAIEMFCHPRRLKAGLCNAPFGFSLPCARKRMREGSHLVNIMQSRTKHNSGTRTYLRELHLQSIINSLMSNSFTQLFLLPLLCVKRLTPSFELVIMGFWYLIHVRFPY